VGPRFAGEQLLPHPTGADCRYREVRLPLVYALWRLLASANLRHLLSMCRGAFAREVRILGSFHFGVEELAEDLVRVFS
jgi:hypothetical protein